MKNSSNQFKLLLTRGLASAVLAAVMAVGPATNSSAGGVGNPGNPGIRPPTSKPYGKSYPEWVAAFWQWLMEYPLPGNPALEQDNPFDLSVRQSGQVWFWAAPDLGERSVALPAGKALFLTLRDVECSSLEPLDSGFHGDTAAEQADPNWLPTPGSLFTSTDPPCTAVISATSDRPIPEPGC